jgi:hypothetical protein
VSNLCHFGHNIAYFLYSLDWTKFQKFLESPTAKQLAAFSDALADGYDDEYDEFDEDDPIHEWFKDKKATAAVIKSRLAMPDWYSDLSYMGKGLWEPAICTMAHSKEFGFKSHSNGIYWDVIEVARKHHKVPVNAINNLAISQFGTRPLRYVPNPKKRVSLSDWHPTHSMHTPNETVQMLNELEDAGTFITSSDRQGAREDYENELMPALDSIVKAKRMLYVSVDT